MLRRGLLRRVSGCVAFGKVLGDSAWTSDIYADPPTPELENLKGQP
jgi:hypothetical protein